jgi:hypothetical protein
VDDALLGRVQVEERNVELGAVAAECADLPGGDFVGDGEVARRRRHVVVHGRNRQTGTPDAAAGRAQPVERLRRSDFVNQVQVNVEQRGLSRLLVDYMLVPEFLKKCPHKFSGRWSVVS